MQLWVSLLHPRYRAEVCKGHSNAGLRVVVLLAWASFPSVCMFAEGKIYRLQAARTGPRDGANADGWLCPGALTSLAGLQ